MDVSLAAGKPPLSSREAAPGKPGLFDIDADEFRRCFDRRPFLIRHRLAGHPLFTLERMVELSRTLPAEHVEYNAGDLSIDQRPELTPRNGLSPQETIRRI